MCPGNQASGIRSLKIYTLHLSVYCSLLFHSLYPIIKTSEMPASKRCSLSSDQYQQNLHRFFFFRFAGLLSKLWVIVVNSADRESSRKEANRLVGVLTDEVLASNGGVTVTVLFQRSCRATAVHAWWSLTTGQSENGGQQGCDCENARSHSASALKSWL